MTERADFITDDHLDYLDILREIGSTNMFGAGAFVQGEFGLSERDASVVLSYWMETFGDRNS
jgi:hypothetical protein